MSHAPILVVCATDRDRRELERLGYAEHCIFHSYASDVLASIATGSLRPQPPVAPVDEEIDRLVGRMRGRGLEAVISTDDYPGAALASVVASELGLPGPAPEAVIRAQHKYYARLVGLALVPEATPPFELAVEGHEPTVVTNGPAFVKPCMSFGAAGARAVPSAEQWPSASGGARLPEAFFEIFDALAHRYARASIGAAELLVEGFLEGRLAIVEGIAQGGGDVRILGVVDAVPHRTGSIERYELPSSLPESVQERMRALATRTITALGFDHGGFSVEMTWNESDDHIGIVEVNPRASSQLAGLFEKVDGVNTYARLLDVARGRPMRPAERAPFGAAVSVVLRRANDAYVDAVPAPAAVAALEEFAGARVEITATAGRWLSDALQDGASYRYGVVDAGGRNRADAIATANAIASALEFRFVQRLRSGLHVRSHAVLATSGSGR